MKEKNKISSTEVISNLIKQATLTKKERERLKKELEQEEEGGKGTIWLNSYEKYDKVVEGCKGDLLSPGGAAARVGISRARVHQLEAEGKIRVYRMKAEEIPFTEKEFKEVLKLLPFWSRPFMTYKKPKDGCYVYVDMESLEKYMQNQDERRSRSK